MSFPELPASGWLLAAALLARVALAFVGRPLVDPSEGRYAEVSREMAESGDWCTPRLNYVKYLEKPPLFYWATAGVYSAVGASDRAARIVPALAGLGCIVSLVRFLASMSDPASGIRAGWILLASPLFFGLFDAVVLDGLFALFVCTSLWTYYKWHARRGVDGPVPLFFYAALALGTLTKGPVSVVIVGGTVLAFHTWERSWVPFRSLLRPAGVALFLGICAPWFLLVSIRNPEFARFFFFHEHIDRFLTTSHHREGPFWMLPAVLAAGTFPWCLSWRKGDVGDRRLDRFLACAALFPVLFFSLSQSKLATYVLPAIPPAAAWFALRLRKPWQEKVPVLACAWMGVAAMAALIWGSPLARSRSDRDLAEALRKEGLSAEERVVNVGHFRPSLAFYLSRPIVQCGSAGEMRLGAMTENDGHFVPNPESLSEAIRPGERFWAVADAKRAGSVHEHFEVERGLEGPGDRVALRCRRKETR